MSSNLTDSEFVSLYTDFLKLKKGDFNKKSKRYLRVCNDTLKLLLSDLCFGTSAKIDIINDQLIINDKPIYQIHLEGLKPKNKKDPIDFDMYSSFLNNSKTEMLGNLLIQIGAIDQHVMESPATLKITSSFNLQKEMRVVLTDKIRKIYNQYKENVDYIIVYGDSSSGKTVSVLEALRMVMSIDDASYTWIDFSDVGVSPINFIYTLLKNPIKSKHFIVVDNIQAKPSNISWINPIVEFIKQNNINKHFNVTLICWRTALKYVDALFKNKSIRRFACNGEETIIELIRITNMEKYEKEIISNSAGDIFVAHEMITYIQQNEQFPSERMLSKIVYDDLTRKISIPDEAQRCLFFLASMGEFEIHVKESFLSSVYPMGQQFLKTYNIYRSYQADAVCKYVTLGHRSLAHQLVTYLKQTHIGQEMPTPVKLAIEYLQIDGNAQLLSTLERLDLELELGEKTFSNLWRAFSNMRNSIWSQISTDVTWGNNMASMIFAAEALQNMRFDEKSTPFWARTAAAIRARWGPMDNCQGIYPLTGEMTSELVDFNQSIKNAMEVDEIDQFYETCMLAKNIDYNSFHHNWLLGLLLGFEGEAIDEFGKSQRQKYIACAEFLQAKDGSFYPKRVCWVTARIIMGLCQCGLSYSDSIVKNACCWLVSQLHTRESMKWKVPELNCGGWKSGTGAWNSNEQITLMCLCALYCASYPMHTNQILIDLVDEFWKNRAILEEHFDHNGAILDVMWILDVMLYDKRDLLDMKSELEKVTAYLMETWEKASLKSNEKETESSDVSFMAKELIHIIWTILNRNMDVLLEGLEMGYTSTDRNKKIFISYRRREGGGSAFAQGVYEYLNKVYRDEIFLDVKDLRTACGHFNKRLEKAINDCDVVIAIITDHSFDRACCLDYNNENDILYQELRQAINSNKVIIPVYNGSMPECPEALSINPDFYKIACDLAMRQSTNYEADKPNAMQILSNEIKEKIRKLNIM